MALWKDLPTLPDVVQSHVSDDSATLQLRLGNDLFQFQGHFPNNPILPGVAQLDWAIKLANIHLGTSTTVKEVRHLKFRRLTPPDTRLQLILQHDPISASLSFEFKEDSTPISSGTIVLAPV
jgi:3-hydroxymyristoyl/3-hydroxydecanoyl-(acyl carrier protein) dehydratase